MAFPVKITGTVYFSAYQYGQLARIFVSFNSGPETDTGISVIPIGTTNVGLFEYWANAAGIYTFRAEARNANTGVIGGSSIFSKTVPPEPEIDLEALKTAKNALGIAQQARATVGTDSTARTEAAAASNLAKTALGVAQEARNSVSTAAAGTDTAALNLAKTAIGIAQEARATAAVGGCSVLEVQVFS